MYRVMLISHGELAEAMLRTAEMIVGKKSQVQTFGLDLGDDVEEFRRRVTDAIAQILRQEDLLVLTDIQSGSPFNVAVGAMVEHEFCHFTGMNLALTVEALCGMEHRGLWEVVEELNELKGSSIINVNWFVEESMGDEED
ncbi:MAG: PTS fructose transporter subunit IIA [Lachnospiraceae bacterium]|jgi:PTS system mannose-specific IIA component|nr:PTS fructose transporter subunit IIA [Lachnospiraceae bacterium]